jgi:hypothetical protein
MPRNPDLFSLPVWKRGVAGHFGNGAPKYRRASILHADKGVDLAIVGDGLIGKEGFDNASMDDGSWLYRVFDDALPDRNATGSRQCGRR